MHVDLADGFQALQGHVRQHVGLNTSQEHVVLHLFRLLLIILLAILAVHDPDSEHELLRVVIIEDAIEVISKAGIDLLRDLLHCEPLVCHPLSVQLNPTENTELASITLEYITELPEEPVTDPVGIKVRHLVVNVDKHLVLGDHSVLGVRIVVNRRVRSHFPAKEIVL